MCGIAAVIGNLHSRTDVNSLLAEMLQRLAHRGPDGVGLHVDGKTGIGMTRLSIVGGHMGNQPVWNERHTVAVVCNGEIYNYQSLRADLTSRGHQFTTHSDVEVIVHLYEEYQAECIRHLEGTFAFILWDTETNLFMAGRDPIGVKPLYYAQIGRDLVFASELRTFAAHPKYKVDLNPQSLSMYLGLRFVPGSQTMVRGVFKLLPGHFAITKGGKLTVLPYWKPAAASAPDAPTTSRLTRQVQRQKAEALKDKFVQAILSQLAPEVRSSVLLSGGLDSTALLALQKLVSGQAPPSLTVAFHQPVEHARKSEYSELAEAGRVARAFGSDHICEQYSAREVLAVLPDILRDLDEPVADPTAIPLWLVSRLAHRHGNRVVFSGEGLDELFNGYEAHRQTNWIRHLQRLPHSWRERGALAMTKLGLPGKGALRRSINPVWTWYQGIGASFTSGERGALLSRSSWTDATQIEQYVHHLLAAYEGLSPLMQMTYFDVMAWLPENTLVKSDKLSMAHGVELRVPFLDRNVVEYAFEFSDAEKLRGRCGKYVVRQALTDLLPKWVLTRKKAGFPVPITAWIYGEWSDYIYENLMNPRAATSGLFKRSQIQQLFEVSPSHRRRAARLLWNLFTLEMWYANALIEAQVKRSIPSAQRG